ncbi:carboxylesterase family protein [Arthrobacter mobilis]|uniref:Carboxylic ester hydrolase n=1 Tax=Arthrobacter mobilis TaxID=2724944 RepID=A0A7X6HBS1_9MICC|nr:carboxylesterase family protein [Arthrobacter mobilis]NKX54208.1 carboxylesterase/lipase family protein [Arthrobacter mobilis]
MSGTTGLAAGPGTGPGVGPVSQRVRPATRVAGLAADVSGGTVRALGIHYGARLDAADRFSPLGGPSPELVQSEPAAFPQAPGSLDWLLGPALMELPQHEDAFQLNVWAPLDARDAPVLVYLPGGAFISGAGTVRWYDGERLAREGGAVVVTINYRLGALGLIGDGQRPSNLAVGDILQALRWVQGNISRFGGDPAQVTLAGQSAGAFYAYLLSQLPQAKGLFRRTALLSLAWQPPLTPAEYAERYRLLVEALGEDAPGLAEVPAGALLRAQGAVSKAYAGRGLGLMPAADSTVPADLFDFAAAAGRLHVSELLLSTTQDEAAAFLKAVPVAAVTPGQLAGFVAGHFEDAPATLAWLEEKLPGATCHAKLVEAMSLHQLRLAAFELAGHARAAGVDASVARFAVASPLEGAGSAHCFEVPFLFGNREQWADAPMLLGVPEAVFEEAGAALRGLLLGFVADGRARTDDGGVLPSFDPALPQAYRIGADGAGFIPAEPDLAPRR